MTPDETRYLVMRRRGYTNAQAAEACPSKKASAWEDWWFRTSRRVGRRNLVEAKRYAVWVRGMLACAGSPSLCAAVIGVSVDTFMNYEKLPPKYACVCRVNLAPCELMGFVDPKAARMR